MSQIRLRFEHWIPRCLHVQAIVLYPYVLFSQPRALVKTSTFHHEMIHVRQVRRLGWLRFYFSYLLEYSRHWLRLRDHDSAYRAISFEREAYDGQEQVLLSERERREIGRYS